MTLATCTYMHSQGIDAVQSPHIEHRRKGSNQRRGPLLRVRNEKGRRGHPPHGGPCRPCIGNVLDFQGAVDADGVLLTMYSATDTLIYASAQIFTATAAGVDTLLECLAQAGAALCAALA